jgi:excisionase family DNA binding protein
MSTIEIENRLERIESLLLGSKTVLTFEEACIYTGISRSYMYKLTASSNIPFSKPNGKVIFFSREKLDRWMLANEYKSNQELREQAYNRTRKKA